MPDAAASSSRAEQQLILFSAGTAARRKAMREQLDRLVLEVDWSRLAGTLRSRKLLPVLGPRILELAGESSSAGFAAEVGQALEAGRRQGAFLQLTSLRVTTMLADAGIRSSALKGPLLGEALYGDPGRRLSGDIDLLVAPEQLQAAVKVVRGLGYGAPSDYVQPCGLPLLHFVLAHERGDLPPVELHWRVHWYERDFARDRLLPPACDSTDRWRPALADELAAILLFYARDGFIDLRLASDLSAWWDVFGANLPPRALDELLRAYPAFERVLPVAARVAERVVGLPATSLISEPKPGLRSRMAVQLANPNPHSSQSQLYADMGLIDGLLAPPGDFGAFVRRQVLPPREVLDQQAQHQARRRRRSSVGRGTGIMARYGLTIARLLLTPSRSSLAHPQPAGLTLRRR
jgi:hypothetical protein